MKKYSFGLKKEIPTLNPIEKKIKEGSFPFVIRSKDLGNYYLVIDKVDVNFRLWCIAGHQKGSYTHIASIYDEKYYTLIEEPVQITIY